MTAPANWIDTRHLDEGAVAGMAAAFAASPHSSLVLDDFLLPRRLAQLRRLFSGDGQFESHHFERGEGAGQEEKRVTRDEWQMLEAPSRASIETMFVGPRPGRELSEGVLAHIKLQEMLASPPFLGFLGRISGIDPAGFIYMPPRIFSHGHFITPHADTAPGRRLCAVFYVSDGWRPGFGGEFRQIAPDRPPLIVDPLPNRFLLFRPLPDNLHEVMPLTEAGRSWHRWAYTVWFS